MSYISLWEQQKVVPQGPFGQTKLYFELEKRPGCESKVAFIFFFEKKSQKALNHVLMGWNDRSRCADFAGILVIEKGAFCVELKPFYCNKEILVPMSSITGPNGFFYW